MSGTNCARGALTGEVNISGGAVSSGVGKGSRFAVSGVREVYGALGVDSGSRLVGVFFPG